MSCGLFGKLPSKRDFVAYNLERPFLEMWETWLQSGVAASREQFGSGWQDAFLAAPLWRFWLGGGIAGASTVGALMPSVDKVGRYFPLSLCAAAPERMRIEPPPNADLDGWLEEVEQFLLAMLEDELPDDPATLIAGVRVPPCVANPRMVESMLSSLFARPIDGDPAVVFAGFAAEDHAAVHGKRSYWWTLGGQDFPARVLVQAGMPEPSAFAVFLRQETGERALP